MRISWCLPLLLLPTPAWAWPADAEWVQVTRLGGTAVYDDVAGDHDVGNSGISNSIDLVGDPTNPVAYWYADSSAVYFRVRLNASPYNAGTGTLNNLVWGIEFETNADTSAWEWVLATTYPKTIALAPNDGGGTGVDARMGTPLWYNDAAFVDNHIRVATAGSNFSSDADYFLDFSVDRADFDANVGTGPWALAFATGSSSGFNALDADSASWNDDPSLGLLNDVLSDYFSIDPDQDSLTTPEEINLGTNPDDADSDDDGIPDGDEVAGVTNPVQCDSDSDGLPDGLELGVLVPQADTDLSVGCFYADTDPGSHTDAVDADSDDGSWPDGYEDLDNNGAVGAWETDPNSGTDDPDTDGDHVVDALELRCDSRITDVASNDDADGDGRLNSEEGFVDADGDGFPDRRAPLTDTDGDGSPDFCDGDDDEDGILTIDEGTEDSDADGIPDSVDVDSDNDGTPDLTEGNGDSDGDGISNYTDPDDTDGPLIDADGDGRLNGEEAECGSDPTNPDSDGDGISDGQEDCDLDSDCDSLPDPLDGQDDHGCGEDSGPPAGEEDCLGSEKVLDCGHLTGGACSTASPDALLFPGLLAVGLAAMRSRKRRASAAPLVLAAMASTRASAADYVVDLDVQRFHPSYSQGTFFSHEDAVLQKGLQAGLVLNYANNPLVFRYNNPDLEEVAIVSDVMAADLNGSWSFGAVRLGLDMPLYLYADGDRISGNFYGGDLRANVHGTVVDRQKSGVGLALDLTLGLPPGAQKAGLGETVPVVTADATVVMGKRWLGSATLGFGTGSGREISADERWGARLRWGLAGSVPIDPQLRAVGELDGELVFNALDDRSGAPTEWRIGAIYAPVNQLKVQLGLGTGLSQGIGAPDVRALVGVAWVPSPPAPPRPLVTDRDGDNILPPTDICPDQAEDFNGVLDADGCPDAGLTPTHLLVKDPAGSLVAGSTVRLLSGPVTGSWTLTDGELTRSLPPGNYKIRVEARGFAPLDQEMLVPDARTYERLLSVQAMQGIGTVAVTVTDEKGQPLVAAVRVMGTDRSFTTRADGQVEGQLPVGIEDLWISAEGYRPVPRRLEIEAGKTAALTVQLQPSVASLRDNEVIISQKIFFELNSADIKPESRVVIEDVAALLQSNPEITRLEIQGHTDDQGAASYNLELSQRRAEAVARYLIENQDIDPNRLIARGYGESEPLVSGTTEEARDVNRRVVFKVLEREGQSVPPHTPPRRPKN